MSKNSIRKSIDTVVEQLETVAELQAEETTSPVPTIEASSNGTPPKKTRKVNFQMLAENATEKEDIVVLIKVGRVPIAVYNYNKINGYTDITCDSELDPYFLVAYMKKYTNNPEKFDTLATSPIMIFQQPIIAAILRDVYLHSDQLDHKTI